MFYLWESSGWIVFFNICNSFKIGDKYPRNNASKRSGFSPLLEIDCSPVVAMQLRNVLSSLIDFTPTSQ